MSELPSIRPPGVFVREIPSRPQPIELGATDVAGFVGFTATAPGSALDDPNRANIGPVTSWSEFEALYGGIVDGKLLPHAVHGYFENGGRRAHIARIPHSAPSALQFTGLEAAARGIVALAAIDELTMLLVPDLASIVRASDGNVDTAMWQAVQAAMIAKCEERRDLMAILDTPPGLAPSDVAAWRQSAGYDSAFAALYYPWIEVAGGDGTGLLVPPSGHVAGVWGRTDSERGVWKAPANEAVVGAVGLATTISDADQEVLNPLAVNAIRDLPSRGIRVWGARTLSSDDEWTFVNVRRLVSMIEQAIVKATKKLLGDGAQGTAVLEQQIEALLTTLWRDGALQGTKAEDAFFVRVSGSASEESVQIGVAPLRPAEFVILRIEILN